MYQDWYIWEDAHEKEMIIHSSMLALRIPWTEEAGGLQSMGSQRVRHDWVTDTFTFHKRINLEKWGLGSRKRKELRFPAHVLLLQVLQAPVPPARVPAYPSKFLLHGLYP